MYCKFIVRCLIKRDQTRSTVLTLRTHQALTRACPIRRCSQVSSQLCDIVPARAEHLISQYSFINLSVPLCFVKVVILPQVTMMTASRLAQHWLRTVSSSTQTSMRATSYQPHPLALELSLEEKVMLLSITNSASGGLTN